MPPPFPQKAVIAYGNLCATFKFQYNGSEVAAGNDDMVGEKEAAEKGVIIGCEHATETLKPETLES